MARQESKSQSSPEQPLPEDLAPAAGESSQLTGRNDDPQPTTATGQPKQKKVHPIIIYPFSQSEDYEDIEALYEFVKTLTKRTGYIGKEKYSYSEPITVLNQQTQYNSTRYKYDDKNEGAKKKFQDFLEKTVGKCSKVLDAWCVDSCQMWLSGIGKAFDEDNTGDDVYWLIPGDFNYSSEAGKKVLEKICKIPEAVMEQYQDFCIGEIEVNLNSSKQLIDTYGTYGLLYNWFPYEAQEIRNKTDKPRTEFWAINHSFLREVLRQRWYAYEQTIVILLQGIIARKRISKILLGKISDLPQGRENLSAAMQQVERTERVLKLFWRETNEKRDPNWIDQFRKLDAQSEQIRGSALVILQNLLRVN